MADIYNLKKRGKYWVPDFTLHGVRVHKSTKCAMKADAVERCGIWAQEIRDRVDGKVPVKKALALRAAFEMWERIMGPQVAPLYVVNMRCAVFTHAKDYLETPIDQITNLAAMEIRSAYLSTTGKGYRKGQDWESERTHTEGGANSVMRRLSALMGWCVEMELIPARPFKITALKPQPHPEGIVWPEQVQAFYAEADRGGPHHEVKDPAKRPMLMRPIPHSAVAIRLMMGLGLREDESVNFDIQWIDRRRQIYTVPEAKDRALREIPIPNWLMEFLDAYRGERTAGLLIPSKKKDPEGNLRSHHKNFAQKPINRISKKLGIPGLTPHRLRATFATTHYEAGTPISQIQQMMGHEDPETTMKYIIQRPKDQAEAQERVAELQGFKRSPQKSPKIGENSSQAI